MRKIELYLQGDGQDADIPQAARLRRLPVRKYAENALASARHKLLKTIELHNKNSGK